MPTEIIDSTSRTAAFEAYGVAMWVTTNRTEALDRLPSILPPGARGIDPSEVEHRLGLLADRGGTYGVDLGGAFLIEKVPLEVALDSLAGVIRSRIALDAPEHIFVHAGVVAAHGRAMLIPGRSFAGKTSLVAALVRAGATYYSDEFAPLDEDGLVHPFAKPLSLRDHRGLQNDHAVETLGGLAGEEPLPIGAVVAATYRPGSEWRPERLPAGRGALTLVSHTVPVRERPEQAMRAINRAVAGGGVFLQGDRGEADEIATSLLAELEPRAA
jgi:hypothetical protein